MMSDKPEKSGLLIKKILVAMDSSRHSEAALEAAVAIAKALEANIQGLFVHDEKWMQICRLPSTTQVNKLTGEIEPLGIDKLEEQIKRLEERIHRRFEQISRRHKLSYSWKSMEGEVEQKLLEASGEADLITIGMKGEFFTGRKKLGSTAKTIIEKSPKPVLILQEGLKIGQSIIALDNGTELSLRGIKLALSLAEKNESKLFILKVDKKPENTEWKREIENLIQNTPVKVEAHLLNKINFETLLNIVNRQYGGLLIIPKNGLFADTLAVEKLLYNITNPILLIT